MHVQPGIRCREPPYGRHFVLGSEEGQGALLLGAGHQGQAVLVTASSGVGRYSFFDSMQLNIVFTMQVACRRRRASTSGSAAAIAASLRYVDATADMLS